MSYTFTKGPWTLSDDPVRRVIKGGGVKPRTICIIEDWTTDADARLLATAPEMYELLRRLADMGERATVRDFEEARAVLAKAVGR